MKKFGKLAVLAALILALACFVSCSNNSDGSSSGGSGSGGSNGNVVATYVCEEPQAFDGGYSLTLKFGKNGKFSVIYTKGDTAGEVSKGSYEGDPTQDGDIVFKVENYADYGYLIAMNQFIWDGKKTIEDQTVTITGGKGEFKFWDYAEEEFTRQGGSANNENNNDNNTQQGDENGNTYANTTWTTTANVNSCIGKFTLTFDGKNGFVFAEKWSSTV